MKSESMSCFIKGELIQKGDSANAQGSTGGEVSIGSPQKVLWVDGSD